MAIISSDIHGNLNKLERFLNYLPEEQHYFGGDILDSFDKSPEEQLACLNALINSDCKLVWGNHENNYRKHREPCSGYQPRMRDDFQAILEKNKQRFKNAYLIDGYILTHAGIGEEYEEFDDPKLQVKEINNKDGVIPIYRVGYSRGGSYPQGGTFWFDHLRDGKLSDKYNQVFGHTASKEPVEYRGTNALGKEYHHVCINTRDTSPRLWVFNTNTKQCEEVV